MIQIGGLVSFTTIDYPGKLATVLFLQGCPLRCPYCHNGALQPTEVQGSVSWQEAYDFLCRRKKLLDGVVFSGGEPLLQTHLRKAIEEVKALGYEVALHTSGVFPERLREILPLLSWVGLDFKSVPEKYDVASGTSSDFEMGKRAGASLDLLLESGIPFEVRTTTDPRVVTKEEVLRLAYFLKAKGVCQYAIQEYRPAENGLKEPEPEDILAFYTDEDFLSELKSIFPNLIIRRA